MSSTRRKMLIWTLPITLMLLSGLLFAGLVFANQTLNGFGIDSDDTLPQNALYSGLPDGDLSNDWAAGPVTGSGVFQLSEAAPHTAAADCYGSDVDFADINGLAAFICDGHADSTLSGGDAGDLANEEELNIVIAGKQFHDVWNITNPGGSAGLGTPKSDFTHGYAYLSFGDSCLDEDDDANELFLFMAGHRADNDGAAYWGFEFNQLAPDNFSQVLYPPDDSTSLLVFNHQEGDLLVSGEVQPDGVQLQLYQYQLDPNDPTKWSYTLAPTVCSPSSELTTNAEHEIEAPPWAIPVCDKTSEGPNQCRLVSGDGADTPTSNFEMIPSRDFMEVGIDLQAYGITGQCFANSFIFTSRASPSLDSSLKDVGGADFHACDANSSIAESATNEVNDPHTFIVTVNKVAIGQSSPAVGETVTITVSPDNITPTGTCMGEFVVTDADGQCTVIIESSVPAYFEVSAAADVTVLDGIVTVATDGTGENSGPATKTFVDASISIADSNDLRFATNEVGMAHTLTVTVLENDGLTAAQGGDGFSGYVPSSGETINVVVTPDASALSGGTCLGAFAVTDGNGQCTVEVNSSTADTFTINVSSNISVGGISLARDTAGDSGSGGSGPATKTFVDARISVGEDGVNRVGDAHTFTIHV